MKVILMIIVCLVFSGCSSYKIMDGSGKVVSQGEAFKILATITVVEKMDKKTGIVYERRISIDSNTKDVLMGLNEVLDTGVETISKVKP